ncbi:flagellar protein FlgN [Pseudomonas sp. UL073]|uniref:Flagellar protein FlgN n=1 Tax=Zestomonas insulae TaxID=2809017 RepID=A0ABS2IAA3_9GAMM|nr:flagellar protein FlgN [Pseudomonas insulae]MBM7059593.1 flagellar protein FlgN [Pseudomonas insulae]
MLDVTLLRLLTDDIGTMQRLLELIDAEFQALSDRDLPRLEQLLGEKQPLLAQLSQHGSERSQIMLKLQLSPDRSGLEALAERSVHGADLLARSDELTALLEQCQNANLRNGRVVHTSQASVRSVLGILRGGSDTPNLYDSRGGAAKIASQRPLSQA